MTLNLYLIRHGQTEWSESGKHTGQTDLPLTSAGEIQAQQLDVILEGIEFTAILTSPLQRASRTCELTCLGHRGHVEPNLTEWNYGEYEGLTSDEIEKRRPEWKLFRDGAPGGESPFEVAQRADRLIMSLKTLTGNVALFSHGHFICALATRWIGLPIIEGAHLEVSTSSVSILGYAAHHSEVPVISGWNRVIRNTTTTAKIDT